MFRGGDDPLAPPTGISLVVRAQLPDQHVLGVVGVLVLIDQYMPEPAAILLPQVRVGLQQMHGGHDQVVEIQRVGGQQPALVLPVHLRVRLLDAVLRPLGGRFVVEQLVLGRGDPVHDRAYREPLRIQIEVMRHHLHQPLGVRVVVDRERPRQVEPADLGPQDAHAGRVEGRDPHQLGPVADQVQHPAAHLGRRLVGEGDGQDRARMRSPFADEVGDAPGQHPGLAGAGAGHHQHRPALVQHRFTLRRVESLQQLFRGPAAGGVSGRGWRTRGCVNSRGDAPEPPGLEARSRPGLGGPAPGVRWTCRDPP